MVEGFPGKRASQASLVWGVGPLMRAIADALAARFNPVAVRGEVSGFSRAASGHCYFALKDESGQVRCAMFRRSADQLSFAPRDGQVVEARGKLDVYGPRGDLQLIVESLTPAGQGALFEQFLRLKALLTEEGVFDEGRKRELPSQPKSIGVVTSLGAAALRDVVTALRRRVPHIPVVIYPSAVQGAQAPAELCAAMRTAFQRHVGSGESEVLLLVRGGGSLEDLWSFNDETLVRLITQAPMPVVCGVGHETDFTLADFAADLRAPTPTAAAEMCAPTRESRLGELLYLQERLADAALGELDQRAQRLDHLGQRLGRPSGRVHNSRQRLLEAEHRLQRGLALTAQSQRNRIQAMEKALPLALNHAVTQQRLRLERSSAALSLLDPQLVLERGYALLTDSRGSPVTRVAQAGPGDTLGARLRDGEVRLKVLSKEQSP
ncbi:exodeoxyribonuclease VII large subunit [Hydrogenophaga crassostreae]|uniref:Exodeoxyribonuclease 7 large subunit n=1 Tax=Hydrogenophaga crassostreae TaxID=1763535 RepID=A0A167HYY8_9BURK|nr:exodeoxyribonuclease VII large subunit [Hydrogenophaga crassostreae]AOW13620.1 exodeoxyribonuclease VII large subunit [Hydrogenophaga crassostreae]OAD41917.1 exodeoxyribonuclease VII large subunit [Hydrogenophaga crassostreae]